MVYKRYTIFTVFFCLLICLIIAGCEQPGTPGTDPGSGGDTDIASPQFSEPAGVYKITKNITLSHASPDAVIRYTTDGTDPVTGGVTYVANTVIPITRGQSVTIKTYALVGGKASEVVSSVYKVTGKVSIVNTDTYTDANGKMRVFVELDPPYAMMRYTQDGSAPTRTHGNLYYYDPAANRDLYAITIESPDNVLFLAYCPDWDDSDVYPLQTLQLKVKNPVFQDLTPGKIVYDYNDRVQIICQTPGANIRFSDTLPVINTVTEGNAYSGGIISLTAPVTYSARAFLDRWTPSDPVSKNFDIRLPAPTFEPAPNNNATYRGTLGVKLDCDVPNAQIYYTLDNTEPTAGSIPYVRGSTVTLTSTTKIRAAAFIPSASGQSPRWIESIVSDGTYNFDVVKPDVDIKGDVYYDSKTITVSYADNPNIKVFYTINGDDPDPAVTGVPGRYEYNRATPLVFNGTGNTAPNHLANTDGILVLKLRAALYDNSGTEVMAISDLTTETYTFKVKAPEQVPGTSEYRAVFNVTPNSPSALSKMYYTVDGSDPSVETSTTRTEVTGPIPIENSCKFRIVAVKDNWADSVIVESDYSLRPADPIFRIDQYTITDPEKIYFEEKSVQINCLTDSVSVFYTLDGTDPKDPINRPIPYTRFEYIPINQNTVLRAYAKKEGWDDSAVSQLVVKLKATPPVISEIDADNKVTLTCNPNGGFKIRYSFGAASDPRTSLTEFGASGTISITKNTFIRACVVRNNWETSDIEEKSFEAQAKTPTFTGLGSPLTPVYDEATRTTTFTYVLRDISAASPLEAEIDCDTPAVVLYYEQGTGSVPDPTYQSRSYFKGSDRIFITEANEEIKTFAHDQNVPANYIDSQVATAVFKCKVMPVTAGVGSYNSTGWGIVLNSGTVGAKIYYTTNGNNPVVNSDGTPNAASGTKSYSATGPFKLASYESVRAIALRDGWIASNVSSLTFTRCSAPTYSIRSNTVSTGGGNGYTDYYLVVTKAHISDTVYVQGAPYTDAVFEIYVGRNTIITDALSVLVARPGCIPYTGSVIPSNL